MRRLLVLVVMGVVLFLTGCSLLRPVSGERQVDPLGTDAALLGVETWNGPYLVVFADMTIPEGAVAEIKAAGGRVVRQIPQIGVLVVDADSDFPRRAERIAGVLQVGPDIIWELEHPVVIEPLEVNIERGITDNDLYVRFQWDIKRVGGVRETWEIEKGAGAVVAVLDTGVYYAHPDIAPNYLYGKSYVVDHWHPVYGDVPAEDENDYHGHGTHVAGAIAAPITAGRIIGVAPEAGIANYKVLTKHGYGYVSWILQGIVDAVDDGVHVINMSLGAYYLMTAPSHAAAYVAWVRATQYAWNHGTLVVASSGNAAADLARIRPWFHVPSGAPKAISVHATGSLDELAWYSNYGSLDLSISAPGGGRAHIPFSYCLNAWSPVSVVLPAWYVWAAGTSMAAPKVSAVAALIYAQNPHFGPAQVRARLFQTAETIGEPGFDYYAFGQGLVNAYRAVTAQRK